MASDTKNAGKNSPGMQVEMKTPEQLNASLNSMVSSQLEPGPHYQIPEFGTIDEQACILILDKSNKELYKTNRFYLETVKKELLERFQVTEIFSQNDIKDPKVRVPELFSRNTPEIEFFGNRTKTYDISGYVLSSVAQVAPAAKYLWDEQLRYLYDTELRATVLTQKNHIGVLRYAKNEWRGYPISLTIGESAANPHLKQFSMQWLVINDNLLAIDAKERDNMFRNTQNTFKGKIEPKLKKYLDLYEKLALMNWTMNDPSIPDPDKATYIEEYDKLKKDTEVAYLEIEADLKTAQDSAVYTKWD